MSSLQTSIVNPDSNNANNETIGQGQPTRSAQHKNYKGFVAGVFSGISKLSGTTKPKIFEKDTLLILSPSWASVCLLNDCTKLDLELGLI